MAEIKNITLIKQYQARNRRLLAKGLTYAQFLLSETWLETKEYLRQFIEYRLCIICKSTYRLSFHHMSYKFIFNPSFIKRKGDIVCLCNSCHYNVHQLAESKKYGLRQAVRKYKKLYVSRTA